MPVFQGGPQDDTLNGGGLDDVILGADGADTLSGGDGNDVVYGHGAADATANGGAILATRVASGLNGAVFAGSAPGDPGALYVLTKDDGRIHRIDLATGDRTVFLDIPDATFSRGGEQGVLGLAFHPQYAANGRLFVTLTTPSGDVELRGYTRAAGSPPTADPASADPILTIPHPSFTNHNGGFLGFSPVDGLLYMATGDGGGGGDPFGNAQNLDSLLGKILRIDVDGDDFAADPNRDYRIPASNPFVGVAGADEIWAYGLRNPWRASFDTNGDFYIGDVGQNAREEVNFQPVSAPGGRNYGWNLLEGTLPYAPTSPLPPTVAPILEYDHSLGQSVTGGYVYRGPGAGLQGAYVYGDFVTGRLWSFEQQAGLATRSAERTSQIISPSAAINLLSSFGQDAAGNLYLVSLSGNVFRLDPQVGAGDIGDTIDGGPGADLLFGGAGNDTVIGGTGNDEVNGGFGDDILQGGEGVDILRGGTGNDDVTFGAEDWFVDGGTGVDTARLAGDASIVFDLGVRGFERIFTNAGNDFLLTTGLSQITVFAGGGNDRVEGSPFGDTLSGEGGDDRLAGLAGNDTIDGGPGADVLDGGDGNDTITFTFADAAVTGGAGLDTGILGATSGHAIDMAVFSFERLVSNVGADLIFSSGAHYIEVDGGAGADVILGTGDGDLLRGGIDGDLILGNGGNDAIAGEAGADRLHGGVGNDTVTGGSGTDAFVFREFGAANFDIVRDYVLGERIELAPNVFAGLTPGVLQSSQFANGGPTAAGPQIIFKSAGGNGILEYDADGTGLGAAQTIAILEGVTFIVSSDIFVGFTY